MQLVKWIIRLIVLLLLGWFAYENLEFTVVVKFWQYQSKPLPLILVIFVSFLAGNIVWFCKNALESFRLKKELNAALKEKEVYQQELANLRNISIDDTIKSEDESPLED